MYKTLVPLALVLMYIWVIEEEKQMKGKQVLTNYGDGVIEDRYDDDSYLVRLQGKDAVVLKRRNFTVILEDEEEKEFWKVAKHREITQDMSELYKIKNHDYGDSFGKLYEDLGLTSAVTQIAHKTERLKGFVTNKKQKVEDEKLEDTLKDLANYCIMTLIEIEGNKE